LSHRYISDRFLPDKAIDLIDEAASKLRNRNRFDACTELDLVERRNQAGLKSNAKAGSGVKKTTIRSPVSM